LGQYFASASHDRTARLWSVERMQPLRIMAGHLSDIDVSYFSLFGFLPYRSFMTVTIGYLCLDFSVVIARILSCG